MEAIKKHLIAKRNIKTLKNVLNEYKRLCSLMPRPCGLIPRPFGLCYIIDAMKFNKKINDEQYLFISQLMQNEATKLGKSYLTHFIWPRTTKFYRINWLNDQIREQKKQLIKFW